MSQVSDVVLANQGFASFRTELNNILGALNTMHVGSSAPASVATGTMWVDSGTSNTLKVKSFGFFPQEIAKILISPLNVIPSLLEQLYIRFNEDFVSNEADIASAKYKPL